MDSSITDRELQPKSGSTAENELAKLFRRAKIKGWRRQYLYIPERKFRADFAFPKEKLIVEVDGGIFSRKAHGSVGGIIADMKRTNIAAIHGWRVMRFRPDEIKKDPTEVTRQVREALEYGNRG